MSSTSASFVEVKTTSTRMGMVSRSCFLKALYVTLKYMDEKLHRTDAELHHLLNKNNTSELIKIFFFILSFVSITFPVPFPAMNPG